MFVERVLVVEDDERLRRHVVMAFERSGRSVEAVDSAARAVELARQRRFDVAIVDLRLGEEWGIDVIAQLKATDPGLRVVMLSGFLSVASAVEALRAGASDVLVKPIGPSELVHRVVNGPNATKESLARGTERVPSLARAQFEHVMRVLTDAGGNISEAARRLGIHRQSLQRHLKKHPPD